MTWLLEWTYRGEKHFERAGDKRQALRMKKNVQPLFPGATKIRITKARELSYSEIKRRERAMGIRQ